MAREIAIERTRNIGIMAHIDAGKTTVHRARSSTTRASTTRSARCTRAPPPWTGWSRSRSAASPSPAPRPTASGRRSAGPFADERTASTSSTRRATSTSPSRSSAACACSTAPWPCSTAATASSRRARRSGARPTSYHVPRIAFVNKMDKVGADFQMNLDSMRERLGVHVPCPSSGRSGKRTSIGGVVDLDPDAGRHLRRGVAGRQVRVAADSRRTSRDQVPSAARAADRGLRRRRRRDHGEVPRGRARRDHRTSRSTRRCARAPAASRSCRSCAARPSRTRAIQLLLDAVVNYLPSPVDIPPVEGVDPDHEGKRSVRASRRTTSRLPRWRSRS